MTACCTASDINTVGIRYINFDIFSLYYRLVFIVFCLDREYGYSHTGNGIGWQFSSGKHDVTKVESGVVDTTELPVRVMGWTEVFEWWLDPLQAGQNAAGPHVDERFVSLYQTLLACYSIAISVLQNALAFYTVTIYIGIDDEALRATRPASLALELTPKDRESRILTTKRTGKDTKSK